MKTYKYIALAALALGFTACSQDDDFTPQQEDAVQIASANIATEVQTRVNTLGDGKSWSTNDQILLVNGSRDNKNSGTYTYDGTTWKLTEGMVLYHSSKDAVNNFTAYYPAESEEDYEFPIDQRTEAGIMSADRMVATANGVAKGTAVALTFERQNAKVTITPTFATQYEGKTITDITDFKIGEITPYLPEGGDAYTAILTPTESGFTVTLKVGQDELTATSSTKIEAGNHYTFSLTVGKEAVKIADVKVTPWTEQTVGGVDTEEYFPTYEYDATNNTYKVYQGEYLQTVIDKAEQTGAAENPATVKIMKDMEVAGEPNEYGDIEQDILVDAGVIVLDLNGHTITGSDKSNNVIQIGYGEGETTASATLAIDDSSKDKQGKIIGNENAVVLYVYSDESHLIVNNGTFEGYIGVQGFGNSSITINGGIFKATFIAIRPQASSLTITGGTFEGSIALACSSIVSVTGGSFTGTQHDIETRGKTGFLSYDADGTGPTFPGGLSIYIGIDYNLNSLLADGAAYYDAEGNQITEGLDGATIEGDVTVKRISNN